MTRPYRCTQCGGKAHNRRSCAFKDAADRQRTVNDLIRQNKALFMKSETLLVGANGKS